MKRNGKDLVAYWQQMVSRLESSGLSVAAFSRRHGISAPSLYHWRRRLTGQQGRSGGRLGGTVPRFVPLDFTHRESTIDVRLASGTSIAISGQLDREAFSFVFEAILAAERGDA